MNEYDFIIQNIIIWKGLRQVDQIWQDSCWPLARILLCVSVLSEHSALCAGLLCRFGLLLQLRLVCFMFSLAQTCLNQLGEPLAHYKKDIESHFQSIKSFQAKLGMGRQVLTVELQQWSVTASLWRLAHYIVYIGWSMPHHNWGVVLERFGCELFEVSRNLWHDYSPT